MKNILFALLSLAILVGCQQNPYTSSVQPGQRITSENPANQGHKQDEPSVEAPDKISCVESETCKAEIIGHVGTPGEAIIKFSGLPAGTTFDPTTGIMSYTPGFDVVNIAEHPEKSMVTMTITVTVTDSLDPRRTRSHLINVEVQNKMQPIDLAITGASAVDEASTLEQIVEVKSPDFPQGPFYLSAVGAPVGTEIKAVNGSANRFTVRFTPSYIFSVLNSSKTINLDYTVSMPVGKAAVKAATWTVNDVRQVPVISAPETTTQGLDVNFSIRAEDMNGEVAPKITVSTVVPFGRITTSTIIESSSQGATFPSKMVVVRWDQLKVNNLGTITPINYEVCVQKYSGSMTFCTQKKVMVTLKADLHPEPKIDRVNWKVGDLKFLKVGAPLTFKMPILDAENYNWPVTVKILSNQTNAVTWKNGILTVNPLAEGILQFSISAESMFGQHLTESFVVEVLPGTWAKTIILTSEAVQDETKKLAKLIPSLDLLSVKYQVSERSLSLRQSCFLTTEALSLNMDETFQDKLYPNFSNILVSSPLVESLKGKIAADLRSFGIRIKGRLSSLIARPDVSAMSLMVNSSSNLESPKTPAGLNGTLTNESKDPLVFDLSRASGKCVPLFNLQKPAFSGVVGVSCVGYDGKVLTVLGFELADVLLDQKDLPLMEKWINSFLTGKGN